MDINQNTYIIAELSANHNNDFDVAKKTIAAMKDAGADAVKFQTYTADSLSLDVDNDIFGPKKEGLWKGWRPYDLFKTASMPYEWQPELAAYAKSIGLDWLSSPFDIDAVDFLEKIDCPAYKIASFEIVDIPLIEYIAKKGKPVIMSTGIATEEEIGLAVQTCRATGNNSIYLLKCTSAYPTPYEEVNLKAIPLIKKKFNVEVGLSDHTLGYAVDIAAVALGAKIIEKHFILDKNLGAPDAAFSMEPKEFAEMVRNIRIIEKAMGKETLELSSKQVIGRKGRRSLFICEDVKKGDSINEKNVRSVRPGDGLQPVFFNKLVGKKFAGNYPKGTPLSEDMISGDI